jgi:hypothetical protein
MEGIGGAMVVDVRPAIEADLPSVYETWRMTAYRNRPSASPSTMTHPLFHHELTTGHLLYDHLFDPGDPERYNFRSRVRAIEDLEQRFVRVEWSAPSTVSSGTHVQNEGVVTRDAEELAPTARRVLTRAAQPHHQLSSHTRSKTRQLLQIWDTENTEPAFLYHGNRATEALRSLVERGLVQHGDGVMYLVTDKGQALAAQILTSWPDSLSHPDPDVEDLRAGQEVS